MARYRDDDMNYVSFTPNIGVRDVDETVRFYCDVLGFDLVMSVPESGPGVWAMVGSGGTFVMFEQLKSLTDECPELDADKTPGALTFYIRVKGMGELYEKLNARGLLIRELGKTSYGTEEFSIADNNGYILTFTETIPWPGE